MLWDAPLIAKLLELYKENRVLWDQKHPNYCDKLSKQMALQGIQEELRIPLLPFEIHRKYRTMRAAYQVEVRNINAAKLRGFYYKPSLHWFHLFDKFMEETKDTISSSPILRAGNMSLDQFRMRLDGTKYVFTTENTNEKPTEERRIEARMESMESEEMNYTSEESDDEFQTFADHIAEQLRSMSVHRAVMIQNKIQRLFARDRHYEEEEN